MQMGLKITSVRGGKKKIVVFTVTCQKKWVGRSGFYLNIIFSLICIFCHTCFSMGDLGVQVSVSLSIRSFVRSSTFTLGILWAQLLLQFCTNLFETLQVFFFMVWGCACGLDIIVRLFFVTFSTLWTFLTSVYRRWVPCERNSSNNFTLIFFNLCTCFLHGLETCMWFGYNLWINFCHFFHFVNVVIFWPQILWKCLDSGTLWAQLLYNFIPIFMQLCTSFFHDLKMCIWFRCLFNFCHFNTLLTLAYFNFLQVRHQLHWSLIYIFFFWLLEHRFCIYNRKRKLKLITAFVIFFLSFVKFCEFFFFENVEKKFSCFFLERVGWV